MTSEARPRPTSGRGHVPCVLTLLVTPFLFYAPIFSRDTIGPEFPLFYQYGQGMTLRGLLETYASFGATWYRPTSFSLLYFVGDKFFSWYDPVPWKAMEIATIAAMALALYFLVLVLAPGERLAATAAALYVALHPALYPFTMEAAPFDFLYVMFTAASVALFLIACDPGRRRRWAALGGSWLAFLGAVTSKELALTVPIFLAAATVIVAARESSDVPFLRRWIPRAAMLLPFFAVLGAYAWLRLRHLWTAFASSPIYRTRPQWDAILANLYALPLWTARIFFRTGSSVAYDDRIGNNVLGIAVLLAAAAAWIGFPELRRRRTALALTAAWVAVFLALPVYSGGFFWHVILPSAGYGVVVGLAFGAAIRRVPRRARPAAAALVLVGFLAWSEVDLAAEMDRGMHATAFRLNNRRLLERPPVPADRLGRAPLVYVEDRLGIGPWWYGCYRYLFDYVYRRHDIDQEVVSAIDSVPRDLREKWARHPNAFFFRYDESFRWYDGTAEFRRVVREPGPE